MAYYGDINGDGKINEEDLIICQLTILYGTNILTAEELQRADVNSTGSVNVQDLIKIRNHILGSALLSEIK